jgi:predicted Zn-dependent protease with MMP-like domain/Flp pilus assembly protein TadD
VRKKPTSTPAREATLAEVDRLVDESVDAWERGDLEDALAAADRARALAPSSSAAHHCRAAALVDLERLDDAEEACAAGLSAEPDDPEALLYGADFYLLHAEGDPKWLDRGLELSLAGLKHARHAEDTELEVEFLLLQARAEEELRRPQVALQCIEQALVLLGPEPDVMLERGIVLFELCRFDDARSQLEEALATDAKLAEAQFYLGLLDERRGDRRAAEKRFRRARQLAPEQFPRPVEMGAKEFEAAVEAALGELPERIQHYLSNVAITVEDIPATDDLVTADPPLSPQSLGLYRGSPLQEAGAMDPWAHFPRSIVLYQRNLERFARSRDELVEQIGITLLHEVGHFLGLDEDELQERGLA